MPKGARELTLSELRRQGLEVHALLRLVGTDPMVYDVGAAGFWLSRNKYLLRAKPASARASGLATHN